MNNMNNNTNNNGNDNNNYEDKRVVVLDGRNKKLDVSDKLEKSDNYRRPIADKSKMCITICDYTNKDKGGSVTVRFNFTPEEIAEFDYIMGTSGDFQKSFDRIWKAPDKDGLSPVKKILISRRSKMPDGKASLYPIYIRIENGRAVCIEDKNKMTSFSNDTYVKDKVADIRLTYCDGRTLFRETHNYIERMKYIFAIEIREKLKKAENKNVGALSESKYVEGVNTLYKGISELLMNQNNKLSKEVEALAKGLQEVKDEIMFGKEIK